ncbi:hypothetical protein ACFLRY_01665 [Bacteroidota bacterium]
MDKKKKLWKHPFGYKEGFIIVLLVLFAGFIVEWIIKSPVGLPGWPINLIILAIFVGYLLVVQLFIKHPFIKWLSTPKAGISAISVFTVLVLLMGFIPQNNNNSSALVHFLGLDHVTNSWGYFLVSIYLMIILGLTTIRRIYPFSVKNFAFFLNHGGLWIVIAAASLGSSDLWRLSLPIEENEVSFTVYDQNKQAYQLPFAVKLMDFDIDVYPPRVGMMKNTDGRLLMEKDENLIDAEEGNEGTLNDYEIHIVKYIEDAVYTEDSYTLSEETGASPAAFVIVIDPTKNDTVFGWVSCGSFAMRSRFLPVNQEYSIAMLEPTPDKYSSVLRFYYDMQNYEEVKLEVNKPYSFMGWEVYQVGYNEEMGKWSNLSVLEFVKDPWLPFVYAGIFMMLLGSLYLVWMGRSTKYTKK